jgi:ribonuclease VapC
VVIDTSALMAIVLVEPDAYIYADAIAIAAESQMMLHVPASVLVEAGIVAEQLYRNEQLDVLLNSLQPEIVPLDHSIAKLARQAFRTFGRGRHPAKLNLGDCMSYATALYLRSPLLYKGEDFRQTDIPSALGMQ